MDLEAEFHAIEEDAAMGISSGRAVSANTSWGIWQEFCASLYQDAFLLDNPDPIPLLMLFVNRYRVGTIAPSGSNVRSRTVENALRAIGQTLATLGRPDPRLQPSGKLDLRLHRQLKGYTRQDPPPHCVHTSRRATLSPRQHSPIPHCGRHAPPGFLFPTAPRRIRQD